MVSLSNHLDRTIQPETVLYRFALIHSRNMGRNKGTQYLIAAN